MKKFNIYKVLGSSSVLWYDHVTDLKASSNGVSFFSKDGKNVVIMNIPIQAIEIKEREPIKEQSSNKKWDEANKDIKSAEEALKRLKDKKEYEDDIMKIARFLFG